MIPPGRRSGPGRGTGAAANKLILNRSSASNSSRRQAEQPDLFEGVAAAERNGDPWWFDTAMQAVRAMAATGRVFQAYDLVETYRIPEPDHPNRWGALFVRAAHAGVIVPVGAAKSRRPTTAGSLTRTWQGAYSRRMPA